MEPLVIVDVDALAKPDTGRRINALRERAKLNQTELARRAGISQTEVSRAESAPGRVKLSVLMKIAEALDVDLYSLSGQKPIVIKTDDVAHLAAAEVAALQTVPGVELAVGR